MGTNKNLLEGPWGGSGGTKWDDGIYDAVNGIVITYDSCIRLIQVVYDKNGDLVIGEEHGKGGKQKDEIMLDSDDFFVNASGHYGPMQFGKSKVTVIKSLKLKTKNGKTYGPYGVEEGTAFNTQTDNGSIVGFFGRSGWVTDAIGFHFSK